MKKIRFLIFTIFLLVCTYNLKAKTHQSFDSTETTIRAVQKEVKELLKNKFFPLDEPQELIVVVLVNEDKEASVIGVNTSNSLITEFVKKHINKKIIKSHKGPKDQFYICPMKIMPIS